MKTRALAIAAALIALPSCTLKMGADGSKEATLDAAAAGAVAGAALRVYADK